jgi:hypothetical protein
MTGRLLVFEGWRARVPQDGCNHGSGAKIFRFLKLPGLRSPGSQYDSDDGL